MQYGIGLSHLMNVLSHRDRSSLYLGETTLMHARSEGEGPRKSQPQDQNSPGFFAFGSHRPKALSPLRGENDKIILVIYSSYRGGIYETRAPSSILPTTLRGRTP